MGLLRLYLRATALFFWTLGMWSTRMACMPVARFDPARERAMRRWLFQNHLRVACRLMGMRIVQHGRAPKPPYYLVCNHLSYLDIFLLGATTGCIFVAMSDVKGWPVMGYMTETLDTIFVDRTDRRDAARANEEIGARMALGEGIVVFPEGKVTRGLEVDVFKSPLIEPAVVNQVPVHYATISYSTRNNQPPAHGVVGWWRPEPFFYHAKRLLTLPGFTATITFGDAPIPVTNRKKAALALHDAVQAAFVPFA